MLFSYGAIIARDLARESDAEDAAYYQGVADALNAGSNAVVLGRPGVLEAFVENLGDDGEAALERLQAAGKSLGWPGGGQDARSWTYRRRRR